MLTTIRTCARPALGARVAACLLAGLLALPVQAAPSTASGTSSTGRDVVGTGCARGRHRGRPLRAGSAVRLRPVERRIGTPAWRGAWFPGEDPGRLTASVSKGRGARGAVSFTHRTRPTRGPVVGF
ncbi:hypothetical protein GAY28_23915, partial [Azospirillum brasilense]|nr:hypothetical protein [Azospirillum brasilense]